MIISDPRLVFGLHIGERHAVERHVGERHVVERHVVEYQSSLR